MSSLVRAKPRLSIKRKTEADLVDSTPVKTQKTLDSQHSFSAQHGRGIASLRIELPKSMPRSYHRVGEMLERHGAFLDEIAKTISGDDYNTQNVQREVINISKKHLKINLDNLSIVYNQWFSESSDAQSLAEQYMAVLQLLGSLNHKCHSLVPVTISGEKICYVAVSGNDTRPHKDSMRVISILNERKDTGYKWSTVEYREEDAQADFDQLIVSVLERLNAPRADKPDKFCAEKSFLPMLLKLSARKGLNLDILGVANCLTADDDEYGYKLIKCCPEGCTPNKFAAVVLCAIAQYEGFIARLTGDDAPSIPSPIYKKSKAYIPKTPPAAVMLAHAVTVQELKLHPFDIQSSDKNPFESLPPADSKSEMFEDAFVVDNADEIAEMKVNEMSAASRPPSLKIDEISIDPKSSLLNECAVLPVSQVENLNGREMGMHCSHGLFALNGNSKIALKNRVLEMPSDFDQQEETLSGSPFSFQPLASSS